MTRITIEIESNDEHLEGVASDIVAGHAVELRRYFMSVVSTGPTSPYLIFQVDVDGVKR